MRKDTFFLTVKRFLDKNLDPKRPVLLGCSGGPDSKALLYLLVMYRRLMPFELHIVHLDHGWREESCQEALQLRQEVVDLGLVFHCRACSREDFRPGNWENQGREKRLQFFSEVYHHIDSQCLMLGHHADDQAEIILKRLCEGSSLGSLGGLSKRSYLRGMLLYRPLLPFSKQKILTWLAEQQISYFQDPTNASVSFLRGRMREEMIPSLSSSFGKQIGANLCRLGEEFQELRRYFSSLNHSLIQSVDPEGVLNLNPHLPLSEIQLKYLLKEWIVETEGVFLSREMLNSAVEAVLQSKANVRFISGRGEIRINRGIVHLIKQNQLS